MVFHDNGTSVPVQSGAFELPELVATDSDDPDSSGYIQPTEGANFVTGALIAKGMGHVKSIKVCAVLNSNLSPAQDPVLASPKLGISVTTHTATTDQDPEDNLIRTR
jgi:hypothetical protein